MFFTTPGEDISMFPSSCFEVILTWVFFHGLFFEREKIIVLDSARECDTWGERVTERDKKKFNFFFTERTVVQ